ncbi:hypothetical protein [Actinomyces slackii]|uniref:hypothetical protein n=1 Tax=Actinomyces slackii TaxID=52774 RepID=UPI000F82232A|nr:hypothetical protein [Actinomyces slackii]
MMPASEYRQYFGLPVTMFQFYHHQGSGDGGLVKSSFSCTLLMKGDRSFLVSIDYRESGSVQFVVSTIGESSTFEEVSTLDGASPFDLEDHEGDGIIFKDRGGRFASIWRYPGGEVVSIGFRPLDEDDADASAYIEKAKNFTRRIVPLVPELATQPDQDFTSYPGDAAPSGMEEPSEAPSK